MKNVFFFTVLFCFCTNVYSENRPVVVERPTMNMVDNEDETMIKDLLANVEDSMNGNNLRDYLECFSPPYAAKIKKEAAVMFVEHSPSIKFDNFQILEQNEKEIEFIVKYTTNYSGNDVVTVSTILAEKEDKKLLIANQQVVSQKGRDGEQVDCKDGKCNVRSTPENRKSFSLFNDANGKPDPNGIMWLDPRTLMEVYPEQYECIGCMKK